MSKMDEKPKCKSCFSKKKTADVFQDFDTISVFFFLGSLTCRFFSLLSLILSCGKRHGIYTEMYIVVALCPWSVSVVRCIYIYVGECTCKMSVEVCTMLVVGFILLYWRLRR